VGLGGRVGLGGHPDRRVRRRRLVGGLLVGRRGRLGCRRLRLGVGRRSGCRRLRRLGVGRRLGCRRLRRRVRPLGCRCLRRLVRRPGCLRLLRRHLRGRLLGCLRRPLRGRLVWLRHRRLGRRPVRRLRVRLLRVYRRGRVRLWGRWRCRLRVCRLVGRRRCRRRCRGLLPRWWRRWRRRRGPRRRSPVLFRPRSRRPSLGLCSPRLLRRGSRGPGRRSVGSAVRATIRLVGSAVGVADRWTRLRSCARVGGASSFRVGVTGWSRPVFGLGGVGREVVLVGAALGGSSVPLFGR
jgi:hypothetical protein